MSAIQNFVNVIRPALHECKDRGEQFVRDNPKVVKTAIFAAKAFAAIALFCTAPVAFFAGAVLGYACKNQLTGVVAKVKNMFAGRITPPFTPGEKVLAGTVIVLGCLMGPLSFGSFLVGAHLGSRWNSQMEQFAAPQPRPAHPHVAREFFEGEPVH